MKEDIWNKISYDAKEDLLPVVQEILVNMRKHSGANELVFRVEEGGGWLLIHYSDNGVGLPRDLKIGNGLRNTGNRIEKHGGAIIFDLEKEKGTHIILKLPLA